VCSVPATAPACGCIMNAVVDDCRKSPNVTTAGGYDGVGRGGLCRVPLPLRMMTAPAPALAPAPAPAPAPPSDARAGVLLWRRRGKDSEFGAGTPSAKPALVMASRLRPEGAKEPRFTPTPAPRSTFADPALELELELVLELALEVEPESESESESINPSFFFFLWLPTGTSAAGGDATTAVAPTQASDMAEWYGDTLDRRNGPEEVRVGVRTHTGTGTSSIAPRPSAAARRGGWGGTPTTPNAPNRRGRKGVLGRWARSSDHSARMPVRMPPGA